MSIDLTLEKATLDDLSLVMSMYSDAAKELVKQDILQWDEEYPSREIVSADIMDRNLYLCKQHGVVVAVFVLNRKCDEQFNSAKWKFPEDSYFVMHRLCVLVEKQHKGIGCCAMIKAEKILKDKNIASIRLAVYERNPYAVKMCKRLGYQVVGNADLHGGEHFVMEKRVLGYSGDKL